MRGIDRRAKYMLIRFDTGTLILHLGMSGSLRLVRADTAAQDARSLGHPRGQRLGAAISRSAALRQPALDRSRSRCCTRCSRSSAPEPLSAAFDGEYLYRATRKRSVAIKQFIMNSQVVVGVGNIYASEALFRARISPRRAARRLTRAEAQALAQAIKDVLGRGDQDRRHHAARLRQCRRRARIFPPEAIRV